MSEINLVPSYDYETKLLCGVSIKRVNFNKNRGSNVCVVNPRHDLNENLDSLSVGWRWFESDDVISYCCNPTPEEMLDSLFRSTTYNGHGYVEMDLWVKRNFQLDAAGQRILMKKLKTLIEENAEFFSDPVEK